jgi:hypothetical protein
VPKTNTNSDEMALKKIERDLKNLIAKFSTQLVKTKFLTRDNTSLMLQDIGVIGSKDK